MMLRPEVIYRRNSSTKYVLPVTAIVFVLFLCFVILNQHNIFNQTNQERLHIHLTSSKVSEESIKKLPNHQFSSPNEVQKLIQQSETLSIELIRQFDADIQNAKIKPNPKTQYHRDYVYHGNKIQQQKICRNPYQLLILCLDDTDKATRDLYRQTWASEKNRILTSDGMKLLDWKVVFVVDIGDVKEQIQHQDEQKLNNDVIGVTSLTSGESKETLKLMSALEWADANCEYTFLVKINSHVFLNTPKMFSLLADPRIPNTELYAGQVEYNSKNKTTFYSRDKTLTKGFPRFIPNAFLMSFDVVDKVIRKFHWSKPHPVSDVYIGELVLQSGIDVWPLSSFITYDLHDRCEKRLIQNGALITTNEDCMRTFETESSRLIPEI